MLDLERGFALNRLFWVYDKYGNVVEPFVFNKDKTEIMFISNEEVIELAPRSESFAINLENQQQLFAKLKEKCGKNIYVGNSFELMTDFGPDRINGSNWFVRLLHDKYKVYEFIHQTSAQKELDQLKKEVGPVTTEKFLEILEDQKGAGFVEGKPAWWSNPQAQQAMRALFEKTHVSVKDILAVRKAVSALTINKEK